MSGDTIARQVAFTTYRNDCKNIPEAGEVYAEYLALLLGAHFSWQPIFGQQIRPVDIVDAMVFSRLHLWLCQGRLLATKIYVGSHPGADADEVQNNVKLASLPDPFTAHFSSGLGDNDGYVKWSQPIGADIVLPETGQHITETIKPSRAPLEVGYTKFETTLLHLGAEHNLARWPYGDEYITLLHLRGSGDRCGFRAMSGDWISINDLLPPPNIPAAR